jgi:heme exporter protein C
MSHRGILSKKLSFNNYDKRMSYILTPNFFKKYLSPLAWPVFILSIMLFAVGIYYALIDSPEDYQQGDMVRVMYVHVPAAWMALGIYLMIGLASLLSVVWKIRMGYVVGIAAAPLGASFAAITLITGAIWGKPMWGTWWVWDARLTSMLVLFLLYLAYIAVVNAGDNLYRAEKPASIIALIGMINVPIVKFSVDIWNSLHQGASVMKIGGPSIDPSMLKPLFIMFAAYITYFIAMMIFRVNTIIIRMKEK